MNHSTNLVRACRDSGLTGSEIRALAHLLDKRTAGKGRGYAGGVSAVSGGSLVTSAVALARTLLATLR